jgi:hypothetical protein
MAQFDWPRQMFGAAVLMATMAASDTPTMAQPIGTFRWQTEPHCNVLTLTVTAQSGTFQLQGSRRFAAVSRVVLSSEWESYKRMERSPLDSPC